MDAIGAFSRLPIACRICLPRSEEHHRELQRTLIMFFQTCFLNHSSCYWTSSWNRAYLALLNNSSGRKIRTESRWTVSCFTERKINPQAWNGFSSRLRGLSICEPSLTYIIDCMNCINFHFGTYKLAITYCMTFSFILQGLLGSLTISTNWLGKYSLNFECRFRQWNSSRELDIECDFITRMRGLHREDSIPQHKS